MATISALNIMLSMDTKPLASDVTKAKNVIGKIKPAINEAVSGVAMRAGAIVATFLSVEKVLGKIRQSFTDLEKAKGMKSLDNVLSRINKEQRAGALEFRDAFKEVNLELEAFILKASAGLAPALNVAVKNANDLVAPLLGAVSAMEAMEKAANAIAATWANLQQIVSGVALILQSTNPIATLNDGIMNGGDFKKAMEANMQLFQEGQKMFAKGFSGEAGLDVLKQIEEEKKKIASTVFIDVDLSKIKKPEKLKWDDLHPGALERGSAASVSAILKIDRDQKKKESEKLLKDQLRELKGIKNAVGKKAVIVAFN